MGWLLRKSIGLLQVDAKVNQMQRVKLKLAHNHIQCSVRIGPDVRLLRDIVATAEYTSYVVSSAILFG